MPSILQKLSKTKLDTFSPKQKSKHHRPKQTPPKIILQLPNKMFSHLPNFIRDIDKEKRVENSAEYTDIIKQNNKRTVIHYRNIE